MCLQINEIPAEGQLISQTFEFDELARDHADRIFPGPMTFSGELRPESGRVRLRGRVEGEARLACSRCLECYEQMISSDFELFIRPASSATEAGERQMHADDAATVPAVEGMLDLADLIREQCHLLLPLKPLCGADCRGLCPTCGADRNRIECACSSEQIDPRLGGLAEFKRNMLSKGNKERSPSADENPGAVGRGEKNDGESKA